MKTTVCALATAAALGASTAPAQPLDALPSVRVSYADLDLGKPAGRAALERRVGSAVNRLCDPVSPAHVTAMHSYRSCRKTTWSGARSQLAAIYGQARYANLDLIVRATSD